MENLLTGMGGSKWYDFAWIISWVFLCIDGLILMIVILRISVAMRHDTISSYLGTGGDGARFLAVMVISLIHALRTDDTMLVGHNDYFLDGGGAPTGGP